MSSIAVLSTDPGIALGAPKGSAVHLAELTAALAGAGAEVLLLVPRVASDPGLAGVTVETLPGPGKGKPALDRLAADSGLARWLEHRAREFGASALYERMALHTAAGSRTARALGVPHLVELNAPLPAEAAAYRRLEAPDAAIRLEREVLTHADVVLPVSAPLAVYAASRGARRVEVTPNGVDPRRFHARPLPGGPPVAALAGRLRPWHGAPLVAEAWRLMGTAAPPLLVVGDGDGVADLRAVGATVTGFVPHHEVSALLAGAGIGLVPYAADAPDYFAPIKLFEYMAAGLAVVAAELPAVTQAVDERTALLVPPGDARALAAAVADLAIDRARRVALASAGRALVASRHTWAHRAAAVLAMVEELRTAVVRP